jgi:DedD protein
LEQQAKERLTGGVILVILLVLLVPELLTGPRRAPPAPPAQPDQAPMRSYTMDLGESPHANSAPVAASTAVQPASEPTAPASRAAAPEQATAAPQTAAAEPPPPVADVPERAAAPPKVTAAKPPPAREPEHPAATWTVQLGTFNSRDNALHLVANLKSHGFNSSVSEATKNGHKLFRVRVGSERDRAAAQKLAARLKAAGEKGGEVVPR